MSAAPTSFEYSLPGSPGGQQFRGQLPFEFFERFFDDDPRGQMPQRRTEGQGSGFLIDASGYIVTNNHVAGGADEITVTLQDGRKFDATLIGSDPKTDLALIKVEASGLPYVAFGDSDKARVGDWIVAIGNPFGLGGTATAGIVSARGRDIGSGQYDDYLQLDAPINFGNSGGPVFNTAGEVVGVNTAIFSPNGGNVGIGFAIPANQAKEIVADLREDGSVERGWLGVQIQDLDDELARSLRLTDADGALVADVVGDGPAARAGVQAGDVITRFNEHEIDSARTLSRVVAAATPSAVVEAHGIARWPQPRAHGRARRGAERRRCGADARRRRARKAARRWALTLRPLTDGDRATLGLPSDVDGVVVAAVQPDSAAAEKGLRPGDVITRVNQQAVDNVAEVVAALNAARDRDETALLLVRRGDAQQFVALSFS